MARRTACHNSIEDPVLLDLLELCLARYKIAYKNGTPLCDELMFTFLYEYKNVKVPVVVQRHGVKLIYLGQFRALDNLNEKPVLDFLNNISIPGNFIPGITYDYDEDGELVKFAVARRDVKISDDDPSVNRQDFIETLLSLRIFLRDTDGYLHLFLDV